MAFDRTKFGGNLNASSLNFSIFIYRSDVDDLATISSTGYFRPLSGADKPENGQKIIYKDDFILVEGTDGFAIGKVNSGAMDITLWKTEV